MSYCRFIEADVYVFSDVNGGIECCGCTLQRTEVVEDEGAFFGFYLRAVEPILNTRHLTTDEMVQHLREHQAAGHYVPEHVFADLEADREDNDASALACRTDGKSASCTCEPLLSQAPLCRVHDPVFRPDPTRRYEFGDGHKPSSRKVESGDSQ